jgi:hypothetical protein
MNPFGQATILVTSENGQNNKTYIIDFQRKGNPGLLSLSYNIGSGSIPVTNFSPTTFVYNETLPIATTAIPTLEYVAEDNRCAITIVPQDAPNGTSKIKLVTLSGDDSLTYTVNFTVLLSQIAPLADLQVNGITIPNFNENTLNYVIPEYPFGTVEMPEVTAVARYADANVVIEQIQQYPGVATITVTAGNTAITRTYTISFSVELKNNTYLSELLIDGGCSIGFERDVYFYTCVLPFGTTELPTVNAIPEDSTSTVDIELDGYTVNITVTALSGDAALYQVFFEVEKNNNAYADSIFIDWQPLKDFYGYLPNYTVVLPHNYVGLPFIAVKLVDPNASYVMDWQHTIPLQLIITVTAEDGVSTFIYTITFELDDLSVASFDNDAKIQVYPNPSSDNIHFVINEIIQTSYLEIYSIDGKKAGSYSLQGGTNTVQIAHFPKGTYLYKIFTDQTVIGVGKFVKN